LYSLENKPTASLKSSWKKIKFSLNHSDCCPDHRLCWNKVNITVILTVCSFENFTTIYQKTKGCQVLEFKQKNVKRSKKLLNKCVHKSDAITINMYDICVFRFPNSFKNSSNTNWSAVIMN
jgi:hypothetical protein